MRLVHLLGDTPRGALLFLALVIRMDLYFDRQQTLFGSMTG